METFRILSIILQCAIVTKGEDTTVVNLSEELAALNKSERQEIGAQGKDKPILRYGFQKTDLCMDYERAFLCVRKCLDFGFDVAYADKRCKCTCFRKKDKAKYTPIWRKNQTNYKLGTPTTKLPAWAQPPTPRQPKTLLDKQPEDEQNNDNDNDTNASYEDETITNTTNSTESDDNSEKNDEENGNNDGNGNDNENGNGDEQSTDNANAEETTTDGDNADGGGNNDDNKGNDEE